MQHFVGLLFGLMVAWFKSRARLEAEILILPPQLGILRRQVPKRLALGGLDRLLFVWICRLFPSAAHSVRIIRPETIVRWHRAGFRAYGDGDHGHAGEDQEHRWNFADSSVR